VKNKWASFPQRLASNCPMSSIPSRGTLPSISVYEYEIITQTEKLLWNAWRQAKIKINQIERKMYQLETLWRNSFYYKKQYYEIDTYQKEYLKATNIMEIGMKYYYFCHILPSKYIIQNEQMNILSSLKP